VNLQEFYRSITDLIDDLKSSGQAENAALLKAGMDGTTSGEVLGNIGLALIDVQPAVGEDYLPRIEAALRYIKSVLPGFADCRKPDAG
jgi:hypothetical protein